MDRRLRFAAVIAVQLALLAAVPARQVLARVRGREITLRTAPVDPFSPFGGHYMTLSYEIEGEAGERAGAGLGDGDVVYLVVEKGDPAWTLLSVDRRLPASAPGRAVLRARWTGRGRFELSPAFWGRANIESAGRFYLPEEKAKRLEQAMAEEWRRVRELPVEQRQTASRARMLVDLRVDGAGNVGLVRLRFGALTFEE